MSITLTALTTEVQARCNALTGSSTIDQVIDAAVAAKKVEQAGGSLTRTTLDTELQRIINLSGGGSLIEDLIVLAASVEVPSAVSTSKRIVNKYQLFSTAGSFTWTRPASINGSVVRVTMIAGGSSGSYGSGSAQGAGGYAGQFYFKAPYDIGVSASVSVIVGNGGTTKTSAGSGNVGSPSSFGTLVAVGGAAPEVNGWNNPSYNGSALSWPGGHPRTSSIPSSIDHAFIPAPLPCEWAAPVQQTVASNFRTGASGLIVPGVTNPVAGSWTIELGGIGFGAGGAGTNGANTGAGARGFVLVEWEEFVDA